MNIISGPSYFTILALSKYVLHWKGVPFFVSKVARTLTYGNYRNTQELFIRALSSFAGKTISPQNYSTETHPSIKMAVSILFVVLVLQIRPLLSRPVNLTLSNTFIHAGLTYDRCFASMGCVSPRRCLNTEEKPCTTEDPICFCLSRPRKFCTSSSTCPRNERCAQLVNFQLICASRKAIPRLSLLAPLPPPKKLPSTGGFLDDCENSPRGRCKPGSTCNDLSTGARCSGQRNCGCLAPKFSYCFRDSDCNAAETCAEIPQAILARSICVATPAVNRWIAVRKVVLPKHRGYSLEPCSVDSECVAPRRCLYFEGGFFPPCNSRKLCACSTRPVKRCISTRECSKQEICAQTSLFKKPVCASIIARDAYQHVEQVKSIDTCPILIKQDRPKSGLPISARTFEYNVTQDATMIEKRSATTSTFYDNTSVMQGAFQKPVIVGGLFASKNLQRSMVVVVNADSSLCSGVLISSAWVLSAAHCGITRESRVLVGRSVIVRSKLTDDVIPVRSVMNHPLFQLKAIALFYDLAVVQLMWAPTTPTKPIKVNVKSNVPAIGSAVRALGYGIVGEKDKSKALELRQVDLKTLSDAECNEKANDLLFPGLHNGKLEICAQSPREGCGIW